MAITNEERNLIASLAQKGKKIADIRRENVPHLTLENVRWAAHGNRATTARGAKRAITTGLLNMRKAKTPTRRAALIDEIDCFVTELYEDHKRMARKVRSISNTLDD